MTWADINLTKLLPQAPYVFPTFTKYLRFYYKDMFILNIIFI
jgi:hypothetical protein